MTGKPRPRPALSEPEQREITRLCVWAGLLVQQHGAESTLVESVACRLGLALGLDSVEAGVSSSFLSVTTLSGGHCITTLRRNLDRGINMHVVTEVQRVMLSAERRRMDAAEVRRLLSEIRAERYSKPVVAAMIGLSCACFCRLMGGDLASCAMTFAASAVAMVVRQVLVARHFNPLVTFGATAFVATSVACQASLHSIGSSPTSVMAASVLLLIPGFPLINAVSDMVKGYVNTGMARWTLATLLILATSVGILLALSLWNVKIWI
jgi:uncharacterized membrane protein YjjP (DUF1212 family)